MLSCKEISRNRNHENKICGIATSLQGMLPSVFKKRATGKRVYQTAPFYDVRRDNGSATIEASLIVPLFLAAVFVFYAICNLLQVKMLIYEALQETAQYLAEYQYAYETLTDATGSGINVLTAKDRFDQCIAEDSMIVDYVDDGKEGILFTKASYQTSDGCIYLKLRYKLTAEFLFFGTFSWTGTEQVCQKAYVGYLADGEQETEDAYVYITDTGDVYHTSRSCYHISLSIRQIKAEDIESGLTPCEFCAEGKPSKNVVYVTDTGERYHNSIACSGLKRTVFRISKKEAGSMSPCSTCGS